MNTSMMNCTKCQQSFNTAKYFTRAIDKFVFNRCYFCRTTKSDIATRMVQRDRYIGRLIGYNDRETATVERLEEQVDEQKIFIDIQRSAISTANANLLDERNAHIESQGQIRRLLTDPQCCDHVKDENTRMRATIKQLRRDNANLAKNAEAQHKFEMAELRKELKGLRRSAKKRRQKDRKRADVQPPQYDEDEMKLPTYDDACNGD